MFFLPTDYDSTALRNLTVFVIYGQENKQRNLELHMKTFSNKHNKLNHNVITIYMYKISSLCVQHRVVDKFFDIFIILVGEKMAIIFVNVEQKQ